MILIADLRNDSDFYDFYVIKVLISSQSAFTRALFCRNGESRLCDFISTLFARMEATHVWI